MEPDGYKKYSHGQYDSHRLSMDMLLESVKRVVAASATANSSTAALPEGGEDLRKDGNNNCDPSTPSCFLRIVDLGAADGSNSIRTIKHLVSEVSSSTVSKKKMKMKYHITFEEHPDSNENILLETLKQNLDWFHKHDVEYDVLMKSFYEPLFAKESVDMFLSYICLHWLDTGDNTTARKEKNNAKKKEDLLLSWKTLNGENTKLDFVMV